jgi:hypothetical protein
MDFIGAAGLLAAGCTPQTNRKVERYNIELASNLRTRGAMERIGIERQFEAYRQQQHVNISRAHDEALKIMENRGLLNTASAARRRTRSPYWNAKSGCCKS